MPDVRQAGTHGNGGLPHSQPRPSVATSDPSQAPVAITAAKAVGTRLSRGTAARSPPQSKTQLPTERSPDTLLSRTRHRAHWEATPNGRHAGPPPQAWPLQPRQQQQQQDSENPLKTCPALSYIGKNRGDGGVMCPSLSATLPTLCATLRYEVSGVKRALHSGRSTGCQQHSWHPTTEGHSTKDVKNRSLFFDFRKTRLEKQFPTKCRKPLVAKKKTGSLDGKSWKAYSPGLFPALRAGKPGIQGNLPASRAGKHGIQKKLFRQEKPFSSGLADSEKTRACQRCFHILAAGSSKGAAGGRSRLARVKVQLGAQAGWLE